MKAMTLRLSKEMADAVEIIADVDRKSVSEVIREAIDKYLEKKVWRVKLAG